MLRFKNLLPRGRWFPAFRYFRFHFGVLFAPKTMFCTTKILHFLVHFGHQKGGLLHLVMLLLPKALSLGGGLSGFCLSIARLCFFRCSYVDCHIHCTLLSQLLVLR